MTNIWSDAILLMFLGMGTVFIFLLLLIASIHIMSAIIKRSSPLNTSQRDSPDTDLAAISAVAYHLYRQKTNLDKI